MPWSPARAAGPERLPVKGKVHPRQARYRLFIVFRGTVPAIGDLYTDDLSTDAKAVAPKLDNCIGNEVGEVARGFLNTYTSCRTKILTELLPRGYEYLRKQHHEFTEQMGQGKGHAMHPNRLTDEEIELYIVGHSLGGEWRPCVRMMWSV